GPSVVATFTSPSPEAAVYGFYGRRARAAGWHATKTNARGEPFTWTKTFPDGAPAYLSLLHLARRSGGVPPHYVLTGSIWPGFVRSPSEDRGVPRAALSEEALESRWEAAPAVLVVIGLQIVLALVSRSEDWTLSGLPWWVWLVPVAFEAALLVPLAFDRPRH